MDRVMTLANAPTGSIVEIVGVTGGYGFMQRILEMGLLPGEIVRVEYNAGRGRIIISVRGTRLGLGRGVASKILVRLKSYV